jgi:hypothetical protein
MDLMIRIIFLVGEVKTSCVGAVTGLYHPITKYSFWYIDNHVKFQKPRWYGSSAPKPTFTNLKKWIIKINKGNYF